MLQPGITAADGVFLGAHLHDPWALCPLPFLSPAPSSWPGALGLIIADVCLSSLASGKAVGCGH